MKLRIMSDAPCIRVRVRVRADAALVLLDAETGSGKTEAALWHFDRLSAEGAVDARCGESGGLRRSLPSRVFCRQARRRATACRDLRFSGTMDADLALPSTPRAFPPTSRGRYDRSGPDGRGEDEACAPARRSPLTQPSCGRRGPCLGCLHEYRRAPTCPVSSRDRRSRHSDVGDLGSRGTSNLARPGFSRPKNGRSGSFSRPLDVASRRPPLPRNPGGRGARQSGRVAFTHWTLAPPPRVQQPPHGRARAFWSFAAPSTRRARRGLRGPRAIPRSASQWAAILPCTIPVSPPRNGACSMLQSSLHSASRRHAAGSSPWHPDAPDGRAVAADRAAPSHERPRRPGSTRSRFR